MVVEIPRLDSDTYLSTGLKSLGINFAKTVRGISECIIVKYGDMEELGL